MSRSIRTAPSAIKTGNVTYNVTYNTTVESITVTTKEVVAKLQFHNFRF